MMTSMKIAKMLGMDSLVQFEKEMKLDKNHRIYVESSKGRSRVMFRVGEVGEMGVVKAEVVEEDLVGVEWLVEGFVTVVLLGDGRKNEKMKKMKWSRKMKMKMKRMLKIKSVPLKIKSVPGGSC
eukprot:scaffold231665_cov45-Attheya_sp.AAC.1